MQKQRRWGGLVLALGGAFVIGAAVSAQTAQAETSSSTNYQMVETEFGASSSTESCSGQYCAKASIGEVGSSSGATAPSFGDVNYSEPILEMIVTAGNSNLGVLTTERTATKTTTIQIRNYLSGGYILQIIGDPPKFDGHNLETPTTPVASKPGTEQFGMNLVANTTPSVGADPVQNPADKGIFGAADPAYATANMFKYGSGDVFARSVQNSGGTNYTLSMIVNISSSTPSGHYSGDFSAVLIPAY